MAKIELIAKTPFAGSGPRGIDVYARALADELWRSHAIGKVLISHDVPSGKKVELIHFTFFDLYFRTLPVFKISAPFIVTIHDCIPLRFPSHFPVGLRGKINFAMQKWALRSARGVITDSVASARDITKYFGISPSLIHVVPLAPGHKQATAKLLQTVKKEYALPDKFILYVGDINWNKNVPGLIYAFGQIRDKDIHLVLVGKAFATNSDIPEYRAISSALAKINQPERVHILGFVPGHHLGSLYRLATLYVQPSWYEGFGLPILESLIQGTPVLSSNQGSLPEVGGQCVHYFNPNKEGELAQQLTLLLNNDQLRTQFVTSGIAWVKNFSWPKVAKATASVYEEVLR